MVTQTYAQADEGFLYPLDRAFFYINKPPMLLPHDDIEEIEFGRPDGNIAASTKTFDLIVRTRAPGSQVRWLPYRRALNVCSLTGHG